MYFVHYEIDGCGIATLHRDNLEDMLDVASRMIIGGRSNEPAATITELRHAAHKFDQKGQWLIEIPMDYANLSVFNNDDEHVVVSDN